MFCVDVMNQPLILNNLKRRFEANEIYTNVGTILISVNPYKRLPLYTPSVIDTYRHRGQKQLAPHVFTIADDAYNMMIEDGKNQSIVIRYPLPVPLYAHRLTPLVASAVNLVLVKPSVRSSVCNT